MKVRNILMMAALAAAIAPVSAAPQSDKKPVTPDTGRFGDATSIAIKYRDYLYGIVTSVDAIQVVLSKTKFGVDQPFKFTKKTKFLLDGKPSTYKMIKVGEGIFVDVDS